MWDLLTTSEEANRGLVVDVDSQIRQSGHDTPPNDRHSVGNSSVQVGESCTYLVLHLHLCEVESMLFFLTLCCRSYFSAASVSLFQRPFLRQRLVAQWWNDSVPAAQQARFHSICLAKQSRPTKHQNLCQGSIHKQLWPMDSSGAVDRSQWTRRPASLSKVTSKHIL